MSNIRKTFRVKSEETHAFRYLGLDLSQEVDGIKIKQDKFVQELDFVPLDKPYSLSDKLSDV